MRDWDALLDAEYEDLPIRHPRRHRDESEEDRKERMRYCEDIEREEWKGVPDERV